MIRFNSRFVRQAIVAFALTLGVSTISFAQNTSSDSSTTSATPSTSATQAFLDALSCSGCTGGSRIQAQ